MDEQKKTSNKCVWPHRHEMIGIVLIVVATVLTLITGFPLAIFGMFIAGAALLIKLNYGCHCDCATNCQVNSHRSVDSHDIGAASQASKSVKPDLKPKRAPRKISEKKPSPKS